MIDKFCKFIKELSLNFGDLPPEFDYENPVLILVDAVLSINRRYKEFVVPRVELIKKENINTLEELVQKIKELGEDGFCKLWNYNHSDRVRMLKELTELFLEIKKELGINNDLDVLHKWGEQSTTNDFKNFNIRGIGFTTFQYIRLLCKANTTKPDRHILRAIKDGIGQDLFGAEAVCIIEKASEKLNVSVRQLDYELWKHYSQK